GSRMAHECNPLPCGNVEVDMIERRSLVVVARRYPAEAHAASGTSDVTLPVDDFGSLLENAEHPLPRCQRLRDAPGVLREVPHRLERALEVLHEDDQLPGREVAVEDAHPSDQQHGSGRDPD